MGYILGETQAAVGISRKWDAREAGREVASSTIQDLNSPPNFFLLSDFQSWLQSLEHQKHQFE